jgi:hypothetical protein
VAVFGRDPDIGWAAHGAGAGAGAIWSKVNEAARKERVRAAAYTLSTTDFVLLITKASVPTSSEGMQRDVHDGSSVEVEQLLPSLQTNEPVQDPRDFYASDSSVVVNQTFSRRHPVSVTCGTFRFRDVTMMVP